MLFSSHPPDDMYKRGRALVEIDQMADLLWQTVASQIFLTIHVKGI